jgi:uncharacterized membrane protein YqjE
MEPNGHHAASLGTSAKRIFRRMLTIGENRFELLLVELQEERERWVLAILLALGVAIFALLAGVALTGAVAVALWNFSPVAAMLAMSLIYLTIAAVLYQRLAKLRHEWQTLPATLDQLKKDRECLEHSFN